VIETSGIIGLIGIIFIRGSPPPIQSVAGEATLDAEVSDSRA
jgi:hypothetical protein